ncbi:DUF1036 domain-containing protein [Brevundimonas sp.]|uniref:DUF1036 domain-containing protein n=1 Tax=Brevundimonas sp. TaxID=1871086 RepID=UPI002AB9A660|nr:DUF1036 domain-containing protein [Brevundimonas sp.]MDZ4361843.1 DUF1036 domain-containing protein [Brevundimonas sp.]
MKARLVATAIAASIAVGAPTMTLAQSSEQGAAMGNGGRPTIDLKVCNRSGRNATVAVSYVQPGDDAFINRGWYDVASGACRDLVTTDNANFYFYADASDGSGRYWKGDHTLCVQYPGPYTFYSTGASECAGGQETRDFSAFHADEPGSWTWNLDP